MKEHVKKILIQAAIVAFFIVFSFIYFYPLLEGKVLVQMDRDHAVGVAQEAVTYQEKLDRDISWTNSLFGGMPTYQIGGFVKQNIYVPVLRFFIRYVLPYGTVSSIFMYLLGFYVLLLAFKVDKWISLIGAIAFALSSYNIIIITAGHVSKTNAIGLMPIILAGFVLIYDKKYWLGAILAMFGLGMQMATIHVQIVYYTALTVGLYILYQFFVSYKEKILKHFALASAISVIVVVLAIIPNFQSMWQAHEISKYSIRGQNDLAGACLLYTSPSPRDRTRSRMPSSA